MKKLVLAFGVLFMLTAVQSFAQSILNPIPTCQNQVALEQQIDAIENQGWVEAGRNFQPIFYFVQPDPPYLGGNLTVFFEVDCEPGVPCPLILRAAVWDQVIVNDNGNCVWHKSNLQN